MAPSFIAASAAAAGDIGPCTGGIAPPGRAPDPGVVRQLVSPELRLLGQPGFWREDLFPGTLLLLVGGVGFGWIGSDGGSGGGGGDPGTGGERHPPTMERCPAEDCPLARTRRRPQSNAV